MRLHSVLRMDSLGYTRTSSIVLLTLMMLSTQVGFTGFSAAAEAADSGDLTGVSVLVMYTSNQAYGSAFALHNMFEWMNATAEYMNADSINNDTLSGYDILVAPGGSAATYSATLGTEGREAIRNFVSKGGSYFGICGGALLGCRYALGLFDGVMRQPVPGVESGTYMIQLAVNQSCLGPDLSDEPENITTLYWESAYLDPDDWTGIHPITTYLGGEYSPMVAFEYEDGSVFLSSPHPEYEENDDRDGTDAFDDLEDPDSEWGLMLKVARWLVDVSPSSSTETETTTGSDTPYIPFAVAIGVVALVAVVIVKRSR